MCWPLAKPDPEGEQVVYNMCRHVTRLLSPAIDMMEDGGRVNGSLGLGPWMDEGGVSVCPLSILGNHCVSGYRCFYSSGP